MSLTAGTDLDDPSEEKKQGADSADEHRQPHQLPDEAPPPRRLEPVVAGFGDLDPFVERLLVSNRGHGMTLTGALPERSAPA